MDKSPTWSHTFQKYLASMDTMLEILDNAKSNSQLEADSIAMLT